jgi:putative ABC transport system permease protein
MGIRMLKGRSFTLQDDRRQAKVAILSETAARMLSPDRDPLGRSFVVDFEGYGACTIVGVVADTLHDRLGAPPPPQVYLPFLQWPSVIILTIRTALAPEAMAAAVRREVARFDPGAAVYAVRAMKDHVAQASAQVRQMGRVLAVLAGLALLLAAVGIYAVMTQTVIRKRHEIGVRLALGAPRSSVLGRVLRKAMFLAASGAVVGVVAAFLFVRVLEHWLVGVTTSDPRTYLGAALVLTLVALGAAYWPARRAAVTDPVTVLRSE